MKRRFFQQVLNPWIMGISFLICISLGALAQAADIPSGIPSGLPDDLSDMSPFDPCQGRLCGESPPRCPWYCETDAIFLRRDRIDTVPLQTLGNQGDIVLSTDDINSPFRAGSRLLLGHTFGDSRWQIDGSYFWIGNWDDSFAIRNSANDLFSPFTNFGHPIVTAFDHNGFVSIREKSQLQNGEVNLRYTVPMPHECLTAKLILGFRYTSVNEQFDYVSAKSPTPNVNISTRTTNDLFGPQIGGEFYFFAYRNAWIDLGIKGALCDNHASQETTGIIPNPTEGTLFENSRGRDATAFVGDLDLALVWQLTPHWTTRIGYQALWINNIAMASRNFNQPALILQDAPPQIDTTGHAVYHGPHIGLECMW